MAQVIASPVVKFGLNNVNFIKGLFSTKNLTRQFFRSTNRIFARGTSKGQKNLGRSLSLMKLALGGFLSFVIVSIVGKLVGAFQRAFTEIPRFAFKMAAELEDGLISVAKTTGFTAEETAELEKRFFELSKSGPLTLKQLLKIAASAGRMGVALNDAGEKADDAVDKIFKFSKSIAKADSSIEEIDTETIALGVGRLLGLFKLGVDQTDSLTSALNSLGESLKTGSDSILDIAVRSASATTALGFTVDQAFGLAGAISALGRRNEVAASSLERIVVLLAKTKGVEKFAKFLGITAKQFAAIVDKDPEKALLKILDAFKGLGRTKAEESLEKLFGSSIRLGGSARVLTQNVDLIRFALKKSAEEAKKASSVNIEFAKVAKTLNSIIQRLKNTFIIAFIKIFKKVDSNIKDIVDRIRQFGNEIADMAKDRTFVSFLRALVDDLAEVGFSLARLGKKFTETFVNAFQEGEDVGFLRTIASIIDQVSDSINAKSIQGIVTFFKLGFKFALAMFETLKNISKLVFLLLEKGDGFFKSIDKLVGSFGRIEEIVVKIARFFKIIDPRLKIAGKGLTLRESLEKKAEEKRRSREKADFEKRRREAFKHFAEIEEIEKNIAKKAEVRRKKIERAIARSVKKLKFFPPDLPEKAPDLGGLVAVPFSQEEFEKGKKRKPRGRIIASKDLLKEARKGLGFGTELTKQAKAFATKLTEQGKKKTGERNEAQRLADVGITNFSIQKKTEEAINKLTEARKRELEIEKQLLVLEQQRKEIEMTKEERMKVVNENVKAAVDGLSVVNDVANSTKKLAEGMRGQTVVSIN